MIDDSHLPDDMTDIEWHVKNIVKRAVPVVKVSNHNGVLYFEDGVFQSFAIKDLLLPTMKGFWVPIQIGNAAVVTISHNELIGLKNLDPHIGGRLTLLTSKMRSFELSPLLSANQLNIAGCVNLNDFSKLPSVFTQLIINEEQLKGNLHKLMTKCSVGCSIKINCLVHDKINPTQAADMSDIISHAIEHGDDPKAKFYKLQQDLVDAGFEEYV